MHAINRVLLVTAAASLATSAAHAQVATYGSAVSATGSYTGEDAQERAAIYTQSAFVMPKGHYGFSIQGVGSSFTAEDATDKVETSLGGAVFSGFYGISNSITVGASLPYASQTVKVTGFGEGSADGMGDAELFGRMRAYRSSTGTTKIALGVGASLPTGDDAFTMDDPTYNVGVAMSHRHNRITFHVAPGVRMVKDVDASMDLNVAASFAATPKLGLSLESVNSFDGGQSGAGFDRARMSDIGLGARFRAAETMVLDLGLRSNISNNLEGADISRGGVILGMNWTF